MNVIIGLVIGIIVGFIVGVLVEYNSHLKSTKARICRNCQHFQIAADSGCKGICGHPKAPNTQYKFFDTNTCGRFDYTDELKTEQVREHCEFIFL